MVSNFLIENPILTHTHTHIYIYIINLVSLLLYIGLLNKNIHGL
jgi:hypothetical protein